MPSPTTRKSLLLLSATAMAFCATAAAAQNAPAAAGDPVAGSAEKFW
jgi:hypothetical protein